MMQGCSHGVRGSACVSFMLLRVLRVERGETETLSKKAKLNCKKARGEKGLSAAGADKKDSPANAHDDSIIVLE